ncbi:MAG: Mur ligase domain-containing protein, partial [Bacteroidota bacterium]|nr:Mur ligase domain-containing protein [Bacteroidota bacterium]MEC8636998.1 Mur ligase domain-containing protein [Bacteroidota bacterium]
MKKLKEILYKVAIEGLSGSTDVEVNHISMDSRTIKPGSMYVAVRGTQVDGHQFICKAIELGAR